MTWKIEISESAARQVRRLDKPMQQRVLDYLQDRIAPADNPHAFGKALTGNHGGLWRYRVGDWRIVCSIAKPRIFVLRIAHRREVYR